jgi:CHAT domain-containing protein/tetratricopeptide (TPR) repeat protein
MTVAAAILVAVQAAVQTSGAATPADSLLAFAGGAAEAALVERARQSPAVFREAITVVFRLIAHAPSSAEQIRTLTTARRLAAAHGQAWDDPFLSRQVGRFAERSDEWRRAKVRADSLRREGAAAFGRGGVEPARALWLESLGLATTLGDTAGMGAATQNLGAAFLEESALDSAGVYLSRARALAAAAGDRLIEGNALGALHFVSLDRGDLTEARVRLAEAMTLRTRIGDGRGAAADLNSLGLLAWHVGDLEGARRHFEAALELNRSETRVEVAATNLTNLAALAALEGDFTRALALYAEALETYRSADARPDVADALWGLGQLDARRGDYPRARAAFAEALSIYEETGPVVEAVSLRLELVGVLVAMGDVQAAVDELRSAEEESNDVDVPRAVRARAALARADLFMALNSWSEAERQYGLAERMYGEAGDIAGQAEARQGQGLLLLERDDHVRAEQVLAGAAEAQEASDDARGAALTRTFIAQARLGVGDVDGARILLRRSVAELERLEDRVAQAFGLSTLGDLEREAGRPSAADSAYAAALALIDDGRATELRWRIHFGRGLVARSRGSIDAAVRELRTAAAEVERTADGLALPERRSAYRADKAEVFAQLALTERMRGRVGAAFEATEQLRAREALELLRQGRTAAPLGIAGDLAVREQDLRVRLGELARELEPLRPTAIASRGPDVSATDATAREALARARDAYGELMLEMRERAPRRAELLAPAATNWRDVARRLPGEAALIEYLLTDSGSVAFVVTPDSLAAVDLGIRRSDLARLVEFSRALIESPGGDDDTAWEGPLRRLHQLLIAPIERTGLLRGATRLVIVPHAEMHYLAFAALRDERGSYLVERYAIALTPSASLWLELGDRAQPPVTSGALAFAPHTASLPASSREVAAVARLVGPGTQVLRGAEASEAALRRLAGDYRVLHFATYGTLNRRNPLFSFVDLAAAEGHDGRLEVHEVFGLEIRADLVVLSACQTGLGSGALADVPEGDDWVGLTRAFLHAGARRVVATLWAVEDEASARIMEHFYAERARGHDDVTALAMAQRLLLKAPETAHPFRWAGVVLVGEQGEANAL